MNHNDENQLHFNPQIKHHNNLRNVTFNNKNSIKIWYFNARSIINKNDELELILKEITKTKHQIHIIAITEHWMNDINIKTYNFMNYNTIFSTRKIRKGGGSALFINNQLKYKLIENYNDEQNHITSVEINTSAEKFIITCIYRQ